MAESQINQFSAERLNTMMVELQTRRTQLLTKFKPDDRLVREVDEQIRITREALEKAERKSAVEEATGLNPLRQTLETELARARVEQSAAMARRSTLTGQLQQYQSAWISSSRTRRRTTISETGEGSRRQLSVYAKKREESRIADELDRQRLRTCRLPKRPRRAASNVPNRP